MKLQDTIIDESPVTLTDVFNAGGGGTQIARIQLVCRYAIVQKMTSFGGANGLFIALCPAADGVEGSTVQATSSDMIVDNTFDKYWFTKSATVTIDGGDGLQLAQDGPGTTPVSHQVSSSISINAGFFGDMPTGGVTESFSSSMLLPDFAVSNQSINKSAHLNHTYRLAATSGGAFNKDSDIFSTIMGLPYDPPTIAKTNLAIPSQGLFVCNPGFLGVSNVVINVTHALMAADATYLEVPPTDTVENLSYSLSKTLSIDWSQVKPPS